MKILVVEDDFTCRRLLQKLLSDYGECDIAVDGNEALEAFEIAWDDGKPYDLVCMDIMMPNLNGKEALKKIRSFEKEKGVKGSKEVKVIMTTALGDPKTVIESYYKCGATSYVVKPYNKKKLHKELLELKLINE